MIKIVKYIYIYIYIYILDKYAKSNDWPTLPLLGIGPLPNELQNVQSFF